MSFNDFAIGTVERFGGVENLIKSALASFGFLGFMPVLSSKKVKGGNMGNTAETIAVVSIIISFIALGTLLYLRYTDEQVDLSGIEKELNKHEVAISNLQDSDSLDAATLAISGLNSRLTKLEREKVNFDQEQVDDLEDDLNKLRNKVNDIEDCIMDSETLEEVQECID
jgi:hypothetical protein